MIKYIVSYGKNNTFTMEIAPFYNADGTIDYGTCFKHVKDMNKEATVEIA